MASIQHDRIDQKVPAIVYNWLEYMLMPSCGILMPPGFVVTFWQRRFSWSLHMYVPHRMFHRNILAKYSNLYIQMQYMRTTAISACLLEYTPAYNRRAKMVQIAIFFSFHFSGRRENRRQLGEMVKIV